MSGGQGTNSNTRIGWHTAHVVNTLDWIGVWQKLAMRTHVIVAEVKSGKC